MKADRNTLEMGISKRFENPWSQKPLEKMMKDGYNDRILVG